MLVCSECHLLQRTRITAGCPNMPSGFLRSILCLEERATNNSRLKSSVEGEREISPLLLLKIQIPNYQEIRSKNVVNN